jgi:hypothetical protein
MAAFESFVGALLHQLFSAIDVVASELCPQANVALA